MKNLTVRERILSLAVFALLGLLGFKVGSGADACELQDDGSELCSILVQAGNSEKSYRYEMRRATDGAPTVVVLPGGPGQGAIGDIHTLAMVQMIPENFGVIAIDPRGVGKNDFGADREEKIYSSALVAHDVYEVIRHENLDQYLIYGESYGTVVATHLAHLLSNPLPNLTVETGRNLQTVSELAKPKAVILNRVVGEGFQDQIANYNGELHRIVKSFSAEERFQVESKLRRIYEVAYAGNDTAFSAAIMQALLFNIEAAKPGPLSVAPSVRKFLSDLAHGADVSKDPVYLMLARGYSQHRHQYPSAAAGFTRNFGMSETIKCRELSSLGEEATIVFNFKALELKALQSDCLAKGIAMERSYHSAKLQVSGIPLIYLQGSIDPVTPLSGAFAHFSTQGTSAKLFVQMNGFAHVGFVGLWPCRAGLWESFAGGLQSTAQHLRMCNDSQLTVIEAPTVLSYVKSVDQESQSADTRL